MACYYAWRGDLVYGIYTAPRPGDGPFRVQDYGGRLGEETSGGLPQAPSAAATSSAT